MSKKVLVIEENGFRLEIPCPDKIIDRIKITIPNKFEYLDETTGKKINILINPDFVYKIRRN